MSKTTLNIEDIKEKAVLAKENQPFSIPENWVWTTIGNCFELVKEQIKPVGNEKYIGLENLKKGGGILESGGASGLKSNKAVFKENDVLYGKLRPYLNKHAYVEFDGIASTDILVYRNKNINISKLLNMYFDLSHVQQFANENSNGINLPRISPKNMNELPFPLPPLQEQERIVNKVKTLINKIDEAKQLIEEAKETFELRRTAILDRAFRGELTEKWREDNQNNLVVIEDNQETNVLNMSASQMILPKSWKWIKLEDILMERGLFDGPFGSNLKTADYTDSGVRVIRLENIGSLTFNDSKKSYIGHEKYGNLMKHSVEEGDIIFASFITEKIRVCILPKLDTAAINKSDCFCIRPNASVIDKEFLLYFLSSNFSYQFLHGQIHGATRPRINLTQLKSLPVPIPSIEEQKKIVNYIKNLFSTEEKVEKNLRLNDYLDKLKQSILTKAFCGELGTNDPTEENAIELLKEVLQEKLK